MRTVRVSVKVKETSSSSSELGGGGRLLLACVLTWISCCCWLVSFKIGPLKKAHLHYYLESKCGF